MTKIELDKDLQSFDLTSLLQKNLSPILSNYISNARWFGKKEHAIKSIEIMDHCLYKNDLEIGSIYVLNLIKLHYVDVQSDIYFIPLSFVPLRNNTMINSESKIITNLRAKDGKWAVIDACTDKDFYYFLIRKLSNKEIINCEKGQFLFDLVVQNSFFHSLNSDSSKIQFLGVEQSNTSVRLDKKIILKLIRKLENGINPDFEITHFLAKSSFTDYSPLIGSISYSKENLNLNIGFMNIFIENSGTAWQYFLDILREKLPNFLNSDLYIDDNNSFTFTSEYGLGDGYHLGNITGKLHVNLANDPSDSNFNPEKITESDLRQWKSDILNDICKVKSSLEKMSSGFDTNRKYADIAYDKLGKNEKKILSMVDNLDLLLQDSVSKIRIHGDYHLGQVLKTTTGFIIIDFEGEPARSLEYRRKKFCALKDVAGMIRSFSYAANTLLLEITSSNADKNLLFKYEKGLKIWENSIVKSFIDGYLDSTMKSRPSFLSNSVENIMRSLLPFVIEKLLYEIRYELNNRPSWVEIPLSSLDDIVSIK